MEPQRREHASAPSAKRRRRQDAEDPSDSEAEAALYDEDSEGSLREFLVHSSERDSDSDTSSSSDEDFEDGALCGLDASNIVPSGSRRARRSTARYAPEAQRMRDDYSDSSESESSVYDSESEEEEEERDYIPPEHNSSEDDTCSSHSDSDSD